jgi:type I restriction enzyme, S subunit
MNDKNYKQTEIGLIPVDWEVKKLSEIGEFSKGKGILKEQVLKTGIPCIRYGEIYTTHDYFIKEFKSFISDEISLESQEITKGDILFAGSGETIEDIGKAFAGGDIIIFKPKNSNPKTISFILELDSSKKQKRIFGQGNSVVHIYPSELKKLKIPLPPLPEQNKIALILSTWDKAIDDCKAVIEKLKERNKGLEQNLLTGKIRLRGFYSTNWKKAHLKDIIEFYNKKSTENDQYEVLTSSKTGLVKQKDYFGENRISERDNVGFNIIPPNYITYRSRSDDGIFTFNINEFDITGIVSIYYPVFRVIKGENKILIRLLNMFTIEVGKYSVGTSQLVLGMNDLKKVSFNLPDANEQKAIENILDKATEELKHFQQKLQTFQNQKKGLMQQLLTGKTRVKI